MTGLKGGVGKIVHSQRRITDACISGRSLERAMKIKEVITRAMSGAINWMQAAEILAMSDRQLRRWKRWGAHGCEGLYDRRARQPSPRRVPVADVEKVLRLYRERSI
jgi:hypothetical protein